jgi:hypothetical protein
MRRALLLPLLLVGVLSLLGATAVGAQAAEPEFGQCVKASPKGSGEYSDKNCQDNVGKGGKYNWVPINPIDPIIFRDEDRGATFVFFPFIVTCRKSESFTEYFGPRQMFTRIVYVECTFRRIIFCTTGGAAEGTIETTEMTGTLGYISREKHEVGVDFTGEGGVLASFQCGSEPPVTIRGSAIAKVTGDVNKMSSKNDLTFEEKEGVQVPSAFEGGPLDVPIAEIGGEEVPGTISAVEKESGEAKAKIEIKG